MKNKEKILDLFQIDTQAILSKSVEESLRNGSNEDAFDYLKILIIMHPEDRDIWEDLCLRLIAIVNINQNRSADIIKIKDDMIAYFIEEAEEFGKDNKPEIKYLLSYFATKLGHANNELSDNAVQLVLNNSTIEIDNRVSKSISSGNKIYSFIKTIKGVISVKIFNETYKLKDAAEYFNSNFAELHDGREIAIEEVDTKYAMIKLYCEDHRLRIEIIAKEF